MVNPEHWKPILLSSLGPTIIYLIFEGIFWNVHSYLFLIANLIIFGLALSSIAIFSNLGKFLWKEVAEDAEKNVKDNVEDKEENPHKKYNNILTILSLLVGNLIVGFCLMHLYGFFPRILVSLLGFWIILINPINLINYYRSR